MQDQPHTYREFRIYKKKSHILRDSGLAFAKDSTLFVLAALAFRSNKHPIVRALALAFGGGALRQAAVRLFPAKPLLLVNEEGITYDPAVPVFNLRVAMAWEEMSSLYLSKVIWQRDPSSLQHLQDNAFTRLLQALSHAPSEKQNDTRFLFILPKDVEAFKRSRGLQDLETFKHGRNLLEIDVSRLLIQASLAKTGTPFLLAQPVLSEPLEEVLHRINTMFADKIEANGIKLPEVQTTTIIEEPSEHDAF